MVILLALVGALLIGVAAGLYFRGFVLIGDRRRLDIMTQHLFTEHRVSALTRQALMDLRRAAADQFKQHPSA